MDFMPGVQHLRSQSAGYELYFAKIQVIFNDIAESRQLSAISYQLFCFPCSLRKFHTPPAIPYPTEDSDKAVILQRLNELR